MGAIQDAEERIRGIVRRHVPGSSQKETTLVGPNMRMITFSKAEGDIPISDMYKEMVEVVADPTFSMTGDAQFPLFQIRYNINDRPQRSSSTPDAPSAPRRLLSLKTVFQAVAISGIALWAWHMYSEVNSLGSENATRTSGGSSAI